MCNFNKQRFFSADCARLGTVKHGQPVDPDRIIFVVIPKQPNRDFPNNLTDPKFKRDQKADYAFRLFMTKSFWTKKPAGVAEETDLDNFTSDVARHQGKAVAAYEHLLHDVWSLMNELPKHEGLLPVTTQQIDAMLPYLKYLTAAWRLNVESGHKPYFDTDELVTQFVQALYDKGWV